MTSQQKYIPPHLRRGRSDGATGDRLEAAVARPAGAARASSSSRWSMVDRDSIRSKTMNRSNGSLSGSSSSSFRTAGPTTTTGPSPVAKTGNRQQRRLQQLQKKQVIFFGDSFVRMFSLIEHKDLTVRAFKGASAKGLGRIDNENRASIVRTVRTMMNNDDGVVVEQRRLVFLFGSVDVHLSYYYKKYTMNEGEIDLEQIAIDYVDFCVSLLQRPPPVGDDHDPSNNGRDDHDPVSTTTVTIVGIYPSPLDDEAVGLSLAAMGSIAEELIPIVAAADDSKLQQRQDRVLRFNAALAKRCRETGIEYIDAYEDVLDPSSNTIKDMYRDVSDYNIHIVWETTLLLWLEKFPWLQQYVAIGFQDKLRQTLRDYLKTKPWAERTHVTQEEVGEEVLDDTKGESAIK
jgi:hypothetical protein